MPLTYAVSSDVRVAWSSSTSRRERIAGSARKVRTSCSVVVSSVTPVANSWLAAAFRPDRRRTAPATVASTDADEQRRRAAATIEADRVHDQRRHEQRSEVEPGDDRAGEALHRAGGGAGVRRDEVLEPAVALRGLQRPSGAQVGADESLANPVGRSVGRASRDHGLDRLERPSGRSRARRRSASRLVTETVNFGNGPRLTEIEDEADARANAIRAISTSTPASAKPPTIETIDSDMSALRSRRR